MVGKAASGDIVIGDIITPPALAFDYDLSSLKKSIGSTWIDMESCIVIWMSSKKAISIA